MSKLVVERDDALTALKADRARLDWLSTATVGREINIGATRDGMLHWVSTDGIYVSSPDGLRAAIDAAMERDRETGNG